METAKLELLFEKFYRKLDTITLDFIRNDIARLHSKDRLIGIKGARGVGKTTLLLQYAKLYLPQNAQTLYVSLDDLFFSTHSLYDLADTFSKQGGKFLLLDEVHRYAQWSAQLKNIYDDLPDLQIIFTGSSMLHLDASQADLSRRAVLHKMQGLSLREFIEFSRGLKLDAINLDDILQEHLSISRLIRNQVKPLEVFKEYLKNGYYPYVKENPDSYWQKLSQTIDVIIDSDLPARYPIQYSSQQRIRKLLYLIATSVPYIPNIQKLSQQTELNRNTVVQFIHLLGEADLLQLLKKQAKGNSIMQKPDKIYLHSPNHMYAIAGQTGNAGTLRETFFLNQLALSHEVHYPEQGDFLVEGYYLFEVGGKSKTFHQLSKLKNAYLAVDDIETGSGNKIPLWLFGFLY